MTSNSLHLFPYQENILACFAEKFITANHDKLPDLSQQLILLANPGAAPALRRHLLDQAKSLGCHALLGPQITHLDHWIKQFTPQNLTPGTEAAQKLLLVDEVRNYPHITGEVNPWAYVDDLTRLFAELSEMNIQLPDDVESFIEKIACAYNIKQQDRQKMQPCYSREATLVYELWRAWHKQLAANNKVDKHTAYALSLQNSLQATNELPHIHLLGFHNFNSLELSWLKQLLDAKKADYYLSAQFSQTVNHNKEDKNSLSQDLLDYDTPVSRQLAKLEFTAGTKQASVKSFYSLVYKYPAEENSQTLMDAYQNWHTQTQCQIFLANNMDEEARAIDIQVRLWLLDNKTNIGIVTENRTLARRVRALLDRSEINIQDQAGWALSTTRFAGLLESWLQCIEENFNYLPYLDIIKSPACFPDIETEQQQHVAFRFEHDLVEDEKVLSDLGAYRKASIDRQARLKHAFPVDNTILMLLFELSEKAARPLLNCLQSDKLPAAKYLSALQESLECLGLAQALSKDAAGMEIIKAITALGADSQALDVLLDWSEFRLWLASQIETARFYPANGQQAVTLMGLSQAQLQNFDAIIIAGLENDILPGPSQTHTFFNDAVKHELGLATSVDIKNEKFYHFRTLLDSAPVQLLTARQFQHDDPVSPCPWLDLLQSTFLQLNKDHSANELRTLVNRIENQVHNSQFDVKNAVTCQPQVAVPPRLIPAEISASGYQQLIDCPYRFFAERCLHLKPIDEIKLQLSRADFGQRIHRVLEAFHTDLKGLPGPFTAAICDDNRDQAEALLKQISHKVFANDLAVHFEHHAWLAQWFNNIPDFITWLMHHNTDWQLDDTEVTMSVTVPLANQKQLTLKGIIDRVDKQSDGYAITDYKTGATSTKKDVLNGEAVQLPFYALLEKDKTILQVSYLSLKSDSFGEKSKIQGEILAGLMHEEQQRIEDVFNDIYAQTPLPAWGDEKVCQYCDISGLCRKTAWQETIPV